MLHFFLSSSKQLTILRAKNSNGQRENWKLPDLYHVLHYVELKLFYTRELVAFKNQTWEQNLYILKEAKEKRDK